LTIDKDYRRCLRFLGMCSSDAGDGINAAMMLQTKMKSGIGFDDLYKYARSHESEFQYAISNFHKLALKAEGIWKKEAKCERAEAEKAKDRKFDPNTDPGLDWTWVHAHTRRTKDGSEYVVRGHWRKTPRKKAPDESRYDPKSCPGLEYEWVAGYDRWFAFNGEGRMTSVRGYWRHKPQAFKKAA
jgi:hypothetical protein